MHRIDTPSAQKDKFGIGKNGFTKGNPQTGTAATALDDDYFDSLQEEICNVIESAGLTLDKNKKNQLSEAINKAINNKVPQNASTTQVGVVQLSSATNNTSEIFAATPKAVKSAYDLANNALPKTGGTLTGDLGVKKATNAIIFAENTAGSRVEMIATATTSAIRIKGKDGQVIPRVSFTMNSNTLDFVNCDRVAINNIDVLKRGDAFATKGQLGTINLNTLTGSLDGNYYQSLTANALLERNYPTKTAGTLNVYKNFANNVEGCSQEYIPFFGGTKYLRNYDASQKKWSNWYEFITTANVNKHAAIPAGVPIPYPSTSIPAGYLKCNGAAFNKTLYPKLAAAYPSGKLPDLRGEFIRGLDDGRGVDSSRTILSAQGDAIRNITGAVTGNGGLAWSPTCTGAFKITGGSHSHTGSYNEGSTFDFDASRVVPTANENRPRNIAFLYIVKAE